MSLVKRANAATNPIGPNVAATTNLAFLRLTAAVNTGFIRLTISDATATSFAQRVIAPSGSPPISIAASPGLIYTISADGRSDVTTPDLQLAANFVNSGGGTVPGGDFDGLPTTMGATSGAFSPISPIVVTSPAGTAFVQVIIAIPGTGARSVGQIFDVRQIKVEGASSGAYFDGDTADTADVIYSWDGTAELSSSTAQYQVPTRYTQTPSLSTIQASTI